MVSFGLPMLAFCVVWGLLLVAVTVVPILAYRTVTSHNGRIAIPSSVGIPHNHKIGGNRRRLDVSMMSSTASVANIIKKMKLKEVDALKQDVAAQGDHHPLRQFLLHGTRPQGISKPVPFRTTVVQRHNTLSVMPEFNKKAKTGFILGLHPPEIMGGVLRDAGAKAIVVSLDKKTGGASVDEFSRFSKEQTSARTFVPGPVPLVWHDYLVDPLQAQYAAALGASAITLYPELVPYLSELQGLVEASRAVQIEPIVMVKSVSEGQNALLAGATVLCLHSLDETGLLALHSQLLAHTQSTQEGNTEDNSVVFCAKMRAELDFSVYTEIDTAWSLRDAGFSLVWPSPEAVYAMGMSDISVALLAMRSKASQKFLSPRQFMMDRSKEGAQEYLGEILY